MSDRVDFGDLADMLADLPDLSNVTPPDMSQIPARHAITRDLICCRCRQEIGPVDDEPVVRYVGSGGLLAHIGCWYDDTDTEVSALTLSMDLGAIYECLHCGRGLIAPTRPVKWCGPRCAQDVANDNRQTERMLARGSVRECGVCGDTFRPARSDATTCSARCRQRKRRAAAKASRIAAPPTEHGQ